MRDNQRMTDPNFIEQLRRIATQAAWQAGQVIKEHDARPRKVKSKGFRDIVTEADPAAQLAAVKAITDKFPDHQIYAEEDPRLKPDETGRWPIPSGVVWIIDPLDGTSNFASRIPMIAASVGVAVDGELVAGAIYDPLHEDMFTAGVGLGMDINGRPADPIPAMPLEESILCVDFARDPDVRAKTLATVTALSTHCRTLRAMGSAALGLAYVAAGRLQLYAHYNLQPWDAAAGVVMIREMGGEVRQPDGSEWVVGDVALIVGHPSLLDEAAPIIS
jgi:myo-inositol-1(or 4)-monophosphatase